MGKPPPKNVDKLIAKAAKNKADKAAKKPKVTLPERFTKRPKPVKKPKPPPAAVLKLITDKLQGK